ncbi:MAG: histidine phosphatase family protein [Clostridium perfringens]|nr:histidine phosphatase family protein [Clostridium perfringens]
MNNRVVLYLMRHGETIMNRAKRVQGWCDGVLTEKGIEVVRNTGVGLSEIEFKAVYTSDLRRTIKTAKIVLDENKYSENLEICQVEDLREAYFGKYEGELEEVLLNDMLTYLSVSSFEEIIEKVNAQKVFVNTCADLDETKRAENYDLLLKRAIRGLTAVAKEQENKGGGDVLVVIHGGILRVIIEYIDPSFDTRDIDNASISKVIYEKGRFKVESVNDMSYCEKGQLVGV